MLINIVVHPGSSQQKIVKRDTSLHVYVHTKAQDGEANKAAQGLVAKHFGVAKSLVKIISGAKSKYKVVEIDS
jgi:uncharacterized protein (TIGR00251 family)